MNRLPTSAPVDLEQIYPDTRRQVDPLTWRRAVAAFHREGGATPLHQVLAAGTGGADLPAHIAELARLEFHLHLLHQTPPPCTPDRGMAPNPTLQLLHTPWTGLLSHLAGNGETPPTSGDERLLLWRTPAGDVRTRPATDGDLLALKLVVEELDPAGVALREGVAEGWLREVLDHAAREGLILAPRSRLRRDETRFPAAPGVEPGYREASAFTLQWHVTHACDLHCRHCYDRSQRGDVTLDQGLRLLDDLHGFCSDRHVRAQVTFTGGNPLLLPAFDDLYRAAVERGFQVAILGNPAPRQRLESLVALQPPDIFQVSLEGLREHNDHIRGEGHFDRVLEFLPALRDLGVHSMVMLTLTRDNLGQVLPLGELLRGRADTFHWNRLSPVGEGARLAVVPCEELRPFLEEYLDAARGNPVLGVKDNLVNLLQEELGHGTFGGCTGHGCGAAFNFLSVLPDGEAHACRKFPSPLGNVLRDGIAAVYDSPAAARYRAGSDACRGCGLAAVCGGCLASTSGFGEDPFVERDPYCWKGAV